MEQVARQSLLKASPEIILAIMELKSMIARMIVRTLQEQTEDLLGQFPAVALLGARQVGKTTLAHAIAKGTGALYLDLEDPADLAKLAEPADYLSRHGDKLVILDEIHRVPALFPVLRSLIDRSRRAGRRSGHFLLLGSASIDLLRQSSEGALPCLERPLRPTSICSWICSCCGGSIHGMPTPASAW